MLNYLLVTVVGKKSVQFNEEVEVTDVNTIDASVPASINEPTIDETLELLQLADPTGDLRPDAPQMAVLEG